MTDRVAIVTGAAGGIGGAVVERLVAGGWRVVAVDRAARVAGLASDAVAAQESDIADPDAGRRAVAFAVERFGGVDLLVNNAGVFLRKPLAETSVEEWDRLVAVNARAPFLFCQAAAPLLAERHGSIVNVASISGLVGLSQQTAYSATKGAVVQLTRQLAIELAPDVRVNAVAPGAVDTEFMAEANRGVPEDVVAERRAAALTQHPLGRVSQPGEVADSIVFLASEQARGITGAILSIDGGYVAR